MTKQPYVRESAHTHETCTDKNPFLSVIQSTSTTNLVGNLYEISPLSTFEIMTAVASCYLTHQ